MPPIEVERNLSDVFGVVRDVPLTYVSRSYVDDKFVNSLARGKHVVVYGGSKQGKTCLRLHCIRPDDYVVVQCGNKIRTAQLYSGILKEAGATVDAADTRTVHGDQKVSVEFAAEAGIPLLGKGSGKGAYERDSGTQTSLERRHLEIDPSDPNDVIRILGAVGFKGFIVLEDFHYLAEEVQRQVAMDLKTFHEKSTLCFIVVGVWLESNRLVLYNGDLAGRLVPIDVDLWKREELSQVISAGETLLNVRFEAATKNEILDCSGGNVGLLQEICYRLCEQQNIFVTQNDCTTVGSLRSVRDAIAEIAKEQAGRYETFLVQFAEGFQKSERDLYRWLVLTLIRATPLELAKGLEVSELEERLKARYPGKERVMRRTIVQALRKVGDLQRRHGVRPPILDFDSHQDKLRVVDGGFTLFLVHTRRDRLETRVAG